MQRNSHARRGAVIVLASVLGLTQPAYAQDSILSANVTRQEWRETQQALAGMRRERDRLAAENLANRQLLETQNQEVAGLRRQVDELAARVAPPTLERPQGVTPVSADPDALRAVAVGLVLDEDPRVQQAVALIERNDLNGAFALLEAHAQSLAATADERQDASTLARAAAAWRRLGALLAGSSTERSIAAYRQAAALDRGDPVAPVALVRLYLAVGDVQNAANWVAPAMANAGGLDERLNAMRADAAVARFQGQNERASVLARRVLDMARAAHAEAPNDDLAQMRLSIALDEMASDAQRRRRPGEAIPLAREALALDEARWRARPQDYQRRIFLAIALARMSALEDRLSDTSLGRRTRSIELLEALHRDFPDDAYVTYALAIGENNAHADAAQLRRTARALEHAQRAEQLISSLVQRDPSNLGVLRIHVMMLSTLSTAYLVRGNRREAMRAASASVDQVLRVPRNNAFSADARSAVQNTLDNLMNEAERRRDRDLEAQVQQAIDRLYGRR